MAAAFETLDIRQPMTVLHEESDRGTGGQSGGASQGMTSVRLEERAAQRKPCVLLGTNPHRRLNTLPMPRKERKKGLAQMVPRTCTYWK